MMGEIKLCLRRPDGRIGRTIAALAISLVVCVGPAAAAEADPAAGELFRRVEERFLNLSTLSYAVKRTSVSSTQNTEERWIFRFRKPDLVRIDYQTPHERMLIANRDTLWEYIPSLKKAVRTDMAAMTGEKREQMIAEVMAHVSVDGLRLGRYGEMEKKAVRVKAVQWPGGSDVYLVEGADPRYTVYIDRSKAVLLRTEIYDRKGGLVIRTEASRFIEAAKGFWMPQEIRSTYTTQAGFMQSTVVLQNIRVDEPMDEDPFSFSAPKGVETMIH